MTIYGWDASDYDWTRGPMDLNAARAAGILFFTHKAWEGSTIPHAQYGEAMRRARAAGIPFLGAYFVPRTPGNGGHGSIAQQVERFLTYVNAETPWWRDYPDWFWQIDTEHWSNVTGVYDAVDPGYGAEAANRVQDATGRRALHYAPKWSYGHTVPGDHPLWASNYVSGSGDFLALYPGDGWNGYDGKSGWLPYSRRTPAILQYSSKAVIGRQATCDANAFRGTPAQFRALIEGGDDMGAQESNILWSMAVGIPKFLADDGRQYPNVLWEWEVARAKREQEDKVRDELAMAAIMKLGDAIAALASGGTSLDTAAVIAEVRAKYEDLKSTAIAENAELKAQLAALQADLDVTQAKLAAAAKAGADALTEDV